MIINYTKSYCCKCNTLHNAKIEKIKNKIIFNVSCRGISKKIEISGDAGLFLSIRKKSSADLSDNFKRKSISWDNQLELTDKCNMNCPICYTDSSPENTGFLKFDELKDLIKNLKKKKIKLIALSGGEPTLHPELFNYIKYIRKQKMIPKILTNGIAIGKAETFAPKLKESGVEYCYFQFDSFKDKIQKKLRGRNYIKVKLKALDNAKKANLQMGMVSVMIKDNLNEAGELLKLASRYIPNMAVLVFLSAAKSAGRFNLKKSDMTDRESVINALIKSGAVRGLAKENFRPYPRFTPMGFDLHPDCAALLFLAVVKNRIEPLENYIDIDRVYKLMNKTESEINFFKALILFTFYILRSLRYKKIFKIIKIVSGLLFMKGRHSVMVVSIEQFLNEIYHDQKRLDHCTAFHVLKDGSMLPLCIYNHPDERRHSKGRKKNINR